MKLVSRENIAHFVLLYVYQFLSLDSLLFILSVHKALDSRTLVRQINFGRNHPFRTLIRVEPESKLHTLV